MTITSRFASLADLEQALSAGQDQGIAQAARQIGAILGAVTSWQGRLPEPRRPDRHPW